MDNKESQFEEVEILYFDDQPESERRLAEDEGCEPGKAYYEEFVASNEVPVCPFCHIAVWPLMEPSSESGCKHLMFIYDLNANFTYVNSDFTNFFWRNFYPQVEKVYEDEEISTMQKEGTLPLPEEILEYIPELKIYNISTVFGTGEIDCGFVSDKFMNEYSLTPGNKVKKNR